MPIDDWFAGRYAITRERIEARLLRGEDPLIIRLDAELVLLHGGRRRSEKVLTEAYDRAKAICHAPAAAYLLLDDPSDGPFPPEVVALARAMRDELVREAVDETGSERALLEVTAALLDDAASAGHVTEERLAAFSRDTEAPMREVIAHGVEAYLTRLDEVVTEWSSTWEASSWDRLLVVICAGHAPRYKESTRSYFCRLLGERHGRGAEGERQVLYAEAATDERAATELAATHLLNRQLGRFFMGSPVALQEDVLGDAAKRILDRAF
ncbi:MAG: hypothetical protein AB7S26_32725 [Sandaracinaceae bacterium]